MHSTARIILIMGVAGSGKTTIGQQLARDLGWPYFEADDFHSAANKDKMGRGIPLTDQDRGPWLDAIRARIDACVAAGTSAVFTCSALKEIYRQRLRQAGAPVTLVYLAADLPTLEARLRQRAGHYMKSGMLQSQLATLELPTDAITVDADLPPAAIIATVREQCKI